MSPSKIIQMQTYMIEFEEEGIKHVKMFVIITIAYIIFWGPLFLVTLINISLDWKDARSSVSHEVFVNPNSEGQLDVACCLSDVVV